MYIKDKKTALLLIMTIAWMGVIFFFSSQPGEESAKVSGFFAEKLMEIFGTYNGYVIRKAGHVSEYLILGILTFNLLKRMKVKKYFISAILVCIVYAATDEIHQMFVPGRGPSVSDVLLDSVSSAVGILLTFFVLERYKKIIKKDLT